MHAAPRPDEPNDDTSRSRALHRRDWIARVASLPLVAVPVPGRRDEARDRPVLDRGGIVRGPHDRKRMTLVFTGDHHAEGAVPILDALRRRDIAAAWFLTGRFLRTPEFRPITRRAAEQGHDLGPHGDQHLRYATWDRPPKLLVSRDRFLADLRANEEALDAVVRAPSSFPDFLPPYEHYTEEVARRASGAGRTLVNYAPGTRSNADYVEDDDPRFIAAGEIVASVLRAERADPDGLNGHLLLMHLGAGPRRTRDHLHDRIGALLDGIAGRGYEFVRMTELLRPAT